MGGRQNQASWRVMAWRHQSASSKIGIEIAAASAAKSSRRQWRNSGENIAKRKNGGIAR